MFKTIITSPYLNIFTGVVMLLTAGYETVLGLEEAAPGVEHGMLVFAIVHILKVVPELVHGIHDIETGEKHLNKRPEEVRREA